MRAELRAKGEVLSRKALGTTPPRWELLRPFTNAASKLKKLNWEPNLNAMSYGSNGVASPVWQMEKPASWRNNPQGTGSQTWQEVTSVMEQAGPILEQIRAIPKEPLGNHGLADKTPIFGLIQLSLWWSEATVVALHRGDRASTLQNVEAGVSLAQIGSEEPDFICQVGRSAVISIGIRPTWEALQCQDWTEAELCRLQAAWESITPLSAAELALKGELATESDLDENTRHPLPGSPFKMHILWQLYLMSDGPDDKLFCLSYCWDGLQLARALGHGEPWAALKPQAEMIQSRSLKLLTSPSRHWIPKIYLAKVTEIIANSARNETARRLLLADIAIKRFKLRHKGALPKSLAELSPDFLNAPSRDPMSGNELLYRTCRDNSYLLYSTGEDGVDDGGNTTPISADPPGLWNAKDVVWPTGGCLPGAS